MRHQQRLFEQSKVYRVSVALFICWFSLATPLAGSSQNVPPLSLAVETEKVDIDHVLAGAGVPIQYVGVFKNNSRIPITIEIVPITGRQPGNGRFGACYLEKWDRAGKKWRYENPPVAGRGSSTVELLTISPKAAVAVCSTPSPIVPAGLAECYRFVIQAILPHSSAPSLFARNFVVAGQDQRRATSPPCPAP
jgi:hypothetical protein